MSYEEWQDQQEIMLEAFSEEIDQADEKLRKELRVLDHYRRDLRARFYDFAEDPQRIPGHVGSKLRDCAKQAKEAHGRAKDVATELAELTKAYEREAELMLRLRKRYDPNYPGSR